MKKPYTPPTLTLVRLTPEIVGKFAAAMAGVHVGHPKCPAPEGGECRCSELEPPKVRP